MISKIKAFFYHLSQGNPKVFGSILISAFFVVLLRVLAPLYIGWDWAVHLEAAHRLVQGLGLTMVSNSPQPFNLNQPPTPQPLTWFPPGLPLTIAGLLSLGLPLAIALKLFYTTGTLLGWFGWAIVGSRCLARPLKVGKVELPIHLLLAAALPWFTTPFWWGGEVFLWAGVPFLVIWLHKSATTRTFPKLAYLGASGLLFGLLYSFRYAALFIPAAAFLILLQVNFPSIKSFLKSYLIFIVFPLFILIPISLWNSSAARTWGLPEYSNLNYGLGNLFKVFSTVGDNLLYVIQALFPFLYLGGHLQEGVAFLKSGNSLIYYAVGIGCTAFVLLIPVTVFKVKKLSLKEINNDVSISLSFIIVAIALFLIATMFTYEFPFIREIRYYIPVGLGGVFILYDLVSIQTRFNLFVGSLIKLIFVSYLVYTTWYISEINIFYPNGFSSVILALPIAKFNYPSNELVTGFEQSLSAIRKLQQENPKALFFVQYSAIYRYDKANSGISSLPGEDWFWEKAYVEQATRIFWLVNNPTCPQICGHIPAEQSIPALSSLPNLKKVLTIPEQGTIFVSDLPSGYKFTK